MSWIGAAGEGGWCVMLAAGATVALVALWRQERRQAARCREERRLRAELEAYARLDVSLDGPSEERALAVRVCRAVVQAGRFPRAALLLNDGRERLQVAGSAGFDDVTVAALNDWGVAAADDARMGQWEGRRSFGMVLEPRTEAEELAMEDLRCRRVLVVPMEGLNGRVAGALVVCAEAERELDGEAMVLEVLAVRLACSVESQRVLAETALELEVPVWRQRLGA